MSSKKPMNSPIKWKKSGAQVSHRGYHRNPMDPPQPAHDDDAGRHVRHDGSG